MFVCKKYKYDSKSVFSPDFFGDAVEPHKLLASTTQNIFQLLNFNFYYQGKMILFFISFILIHKYMSMDIDLGNVDLPNNVLKFGYSINSKYIGKVSHSFDRFYVVTKFELLKVENLQFDDIP